MTTVLSPASTRLERTTDARVTQLGVLHAEWVKFRSVRSRLVTLLVSGGAAIALGALFASFAARGSGSRRPTDSLSLSLGGFGLVQLAVAVVGVLLVTGEYSSGLVRTTFGAVARRLPVVWAKAAVAGLATAVVMVPAALGAYLAGRRTYNGALPFEALGQPGVLRAVVGAGIYAAGVAVLGVAVGFLVRSTGLAVGVLFAGLLVIPPLTELLPTSVSNVVTKLMPSNAGQSFSSVVPTKGMLSPGAGVAVFALWIVALLTAAAVVVRRRDA